MKKNYKVYILQSESDLSYFKIGKTNNNSRINELKRMGYGRKQDWNEVYKIEAINDLAAYAIEALISAKLEQLGFKLDKVMWPYLNSKKKKGEIVGGTELYRAVSISHKLH